jgi:long-chain fatty acid transport protein
MKRSQFCNKVVPLAVALAIGGHAGGAAASGFALIEQSVSGLGNAFAGGAAATDDASVQFYNPAALTEIKGTQASAAMHYIIPSGEISNASSTVTAPTALGSPSVTGTIDDAGVNGLVPNFYYTRDLSSQLKFGFAVNVPFGLSTEYDATWIGRYHALKSSVETINLNPALAFKFNDQLSLGVGVSAQYIKAELTSAIDSGSICYGSAGPFVGALCTPNGLTPGNQAVDSYANIEGDDWGYGINLGLLYKPTSSMRVGVAYRSSVKQRLEGDANFTRSAAFNTFLTTVGSLQFTNTSVTAGIDLPASLSLSMAHVVSPSLELMGDITWTQWSKFQELRIDYANPVQLDSVTTENWNDTLRYALGLSYKMNDNVKLRTGLAYDEAPVPDEQHRTPRIPDNDRTWIALGMTYTSSDRLSFDVGYAHLFVKDSTINNTTEASIANNLQGEYANKVDILSAQLNYKF